MKSVQSGDHQRSETIARNASFRREVCVDEVCRRGFEAVG